MHLVQKLCEDDEIIWAHRTATRQEALAQNAGVRGASGFGEVAVGELQGEPVAAVSVQVVATILQLLNSR